MRSLIVTAALCFASLAQAQRTPDPAPLPRPQLAEPAHSTRSTSHPKAAPDEAQLQSHQHYTTSDGRAVHSPAKSKNSQVPTGASAQCRDGTYSFSQHRRGTCSHHGGVGAWLQSPMYSLTPYSLQVGQ